MACVDFLRTHKKRTWEILMMGTIAIMPSFTGAQLYSQHNMSVAVVRNLEEINASSLAKWSATFAEGTPLEKLSMNYWEKQAFLEGF